MPIPGAQQHKRPRRRYEEIERMYKCGWNGCEKAYGTLNHLNAHVTMQSHGPKRTPEGMSMLQNPNVVVRKFRSCGGGWARLRASTRPPHVFDFVPPLGVSWFRCQWLTFVYLEFKEIRKEWKARKKEEENQRKAEEERQRQAAQAAAQNGDPQAPDGPPTSTYPGSRPVTLPPIGYQTTQYPAPPSGSVGQQPMADYQNHMYSNYPPPHSPYGQPNQGMYNQGELPAR